MIALHQDLFDEGRQALEDGDLATAERLANEGLAACRRAGAPAVAAAPGWYLLGAVRADRLDDDAALRLARQARDLDPTLGDAAHLEARLLLARWDLAGADAVLAACQEPEQYGDLPYLRAIIAEVDGRAADADRFYAAAHALDPEAYPLPVRITDDEVHELVDATIARMPADVVATFHNLSIDVLDVPDPVLHRDIDPETLGLYAGTPVGDMSATGVALPDRVYIFKRNLERIAQDREELIEQLRITLLHELGHHLGWDEDDLEARGLA